MLVPLVCVCPARAFIELEGAGRHDRGYRVIIDELRKSVPDKQDGEAVEGRDEALKLHAIHACPALFALALSRSVAACDSDGVGWS